MNEQILKYPRTKHIEGSRLQPGDEDLDSTPFAAIAGRHLVVEEKMDGANSAISFSQGGTLLLQSRGHFLTGGPREKHFNLLKQWAPCHTSALWQVLGCRYVMFGEWMFAKHTMFYDELPHYFREFDIFDRDRDEFLTTARRRQMLAGLPVASVPVLHEGVVTDYETLVGTAVRSRHISAKHSESLDAACREAGVPLELGRQQTDRTGLTEGLYVKVEESGRVVERYKWIRHSFLTSVLESETHWLNRPIIRNRLADGVDIFSQ